MEFKNQYLTFKEYQELEGTLREMPFNLLEFKSRKKIDELTSGRISKLETIPSEVKLCVNDLIKVFYDDENQVLASDGVGDYNPPKRGVDEINKIKNDIVYTYLNELYIDGIRVTCVGCDF